jgi:hypothetical protein
MIKTFFVWLVACAVAAPLAAQTGPVSGHDEDDLSFRGVGFVMGQQFAAKTSFNAVFGNSYEQFFGGGVLLAERGVYLELAISRFKKSGQRAFISNGQTYPLGIPMTVSVSPFEVTGGYRFRRRSAIIPYAGVGFGSYGYKETSSFADTGEDVDVRHAGFLVVGGAEFRVHRLIGLAVDVQRTHIPGILGTAGLSKDAGEDDLGGTSVRAKVIVGVGR